MFDLEMMGSDAQDDLRVSIGAGQIKMPPQKMSRKPSGEPDEHELLSQLEKSRVEYDALKSEKEKIVRSQQVQRLEDTIEMRETIEILKEESLVKNELLTKLESQVKKAEEEVSF